MEKPHSQFEMQLVKYDIFGDEGGLPPMLEPARGGQHPALESQKKKPTRSGEEEKRVTKRLRFSLVIRL